jgi:ankyrin repeat protein
MPKKIIKNHFLILLAAAFLSTSVTARELPGSWPGALQLGSAYDSERHQEYNASCVTGTAVPVGEVDGDILYTSEADFEKIVKAFNGSASLDVKAPFTKVKASFEYARQNAATDNRMNWFFEYNATRKSTAFSVRDFGPSTYGREALEVGYEEVLSACGDEYVSKIDLGARLIGTMSVEFASKEDKEEFKLAAALDVNLKLASAKASASMRTMQKKMGSRTIVRVNAHQKGGNPGHLTGILGNGEIVSCSLSDMDKCLRAFENILRYASGDFKAQLENEAGYNVIRYHTASYKDGAARILVPRHGFPMLNEQVELKRERIQYAYERELANYTRANYIINNLEHLILDPQREAVRDIFSKSSANMLKLTRAMKECLDHSQERCLDYDYERQLQLYDKNILEVKVVERLDPNSNLGKLHKAICDNNVDAADQLIRFGGQKLITECDRQGYNACHRSVEKGHTRLLSLFIEEDPYKEVADKRIVLTPSDNARKYTPLHLAAEGGTFEHVRCMDLLCAKGAGVDCQIANGLTPLQVAVSCGNKETTSKLVSMGANPYVRADENRTLLHLAAVAGNVDVIQYLIVDKELNVNENDKNGMTPLHWAARAGKVEAINALLGYGADHQAIDREGRTALDLGLKHEEVVRKLLNFHQLPLKVRESSGGNTGGGYGGLSFSPDSSKVGCGGFGANIFDTKTAQGYGFGPSSVRCTAFSPDASMFAWGSDDRRLRISSFRTGSQLDLLGHEAGIYGVAFSPQGLIVASSSSGEIRIWRTDTGTCLRTLSGHSNSIYDIDFSPNGMMLASGSDDETVKIWDPETGVLIHTIAGHIPLQFAQGGNKNYVRSVAFSPDGSILASGNADKTIKLWDTRNWNLIRTIQAHDGWVQALAFSPDNLLIASGATYDPMVKLWDVKNGVLVHSIPQNSTGGVYGLAFSPDGFTLAGKTYNISLWNLRWESILHCAVRAGKLSVVRMVAEKFPLLRFIRSPQGQLPLELAEALLRDQGDIRNQELQAIVDYLRR